MIMKTKLRVSIFLIVQMRCTNVEDLENEAKLRKDVLNYLSRWRLNVKG